MNRVHDFEYPKLSLQVTTLLSNDWLVVHVSVALAKSPLKEAIDEHIKLLRGFAPSE